MSKKAIVDNNEKVDDIITIEKTDNSESQLNKSTKENKSKESIKRKISPLIEIGSKVKVKAGSKTYSGVQIANFVYNNTWIVKEVDGNRVVIDKDTSGKHSILTVIHKDNLIFV